MTQQQQAKTERREVKASALDLQRVDARPDVVVRLLAQTHQRTGVGLYTLSQ